MMLIQSVVDMRLLPARVAADLHGRQVEEASCPMDADLADLLVCGRPVIHADERELAPGSIVDLATFSHGRGTRERQGDFEGTADARPRCVGSR